MGARSEGEPLPKKHRTTVERKSDREVVVTRTFDAPARLVFEAWTKAELFKRWWVPKSFGLTLLSCEIDARVGGKYRLVFRHPATEQPMAFFGRYVEVTPHSRLVWTNEEAGEAGAVTTVTFEAKGGQTLVVMHDRYPSKEALDAGIGSTDGVGETLEQLDELLVALGPSGGRLTFALNVTLDGCCDHREGLADDELHDHFTRLIGTAGAMLFGRTTYELMEAHWPAVARDEKASRSDREWAQKLEAMPKHVVSASRRHFPWSNSFPVEGDLREAVTQLKARTPQGVLVGSPRLSAALERLGLIDEYHLVIHPVLAGHGPYLFQGLERARQLALVSTTCLKSGLTAMHYRRKEG